MSGKFELAQSSNGKFMFNLKAENGQVVLTSQMYEARSSATQGIDSVRVNAPFDERYERLQSSRGQPYFVLKAANGQVIGNSQMYASAAGVEGGIASVKKNAPNAMLIDTTSPSR